MINATFVLNGKLKLVLTPSTALEKEMLAQLFQQETVGTLHDKLQIGDKQLPDSVIIEHAISPMVAV